MDMFCDQVAERCSCPQVPSNGPKSVSKERALQADSSRASAGRAAAEAAASIPTGHVVIGVAGTATATVAEEGEAGVAGSGAATATATAPAERAANSAAKALVTATATAPAGRGSAAEPAVASPRAAGEGTRGPSKQGSGDDDDWTDFEDEHGSVDEIRLSPKTVQGATDSCLALLHGIQNVLLSAQGELNSSANTSEFQRAMQEAELKITNVSSILNETEDRKEGQEVEKVKSQTFDVAEGGNFDCKDFHTSLNTEIQKHARELSVFRDEAFRLIENWKSADSPPATPEELEFLQELSLLLDSKTEKTEKCEDDAFSLARQLLKFWNAANFPLTPVARRGLLRLQEVLEVPEQKIEGTLRMDNSCGGTEGIREVEAALREVRDAFRDVKHVFEVQRCFRDLRECFRDVRRAYRNREPRPRALPPCADAPAAAAAAAAAALAEAVAQAKKRGRTASDISGSRTPSPAGTPTHSQPKKKQQQCATCKAMVADGTGQGLLGPAEIVTATTLTTDSPQTEVSKASHLAATMTSNLGDSSGTTLDQASQTISTGAVLALHLLPDE